MKKTLAMAFMGLAMGLSAHAVRAVHKLFPQKQSDGTTVMLYTNGIDRLAFYTTADEQVVVRDSNGTLCYAALKNGELVATSVPVHNIGERTAAEIAFVKANTLKPTDEALEKYFAPKSSLQEGQNRGPHRTVVASTEDGLGKYGTSGMGALPSLGDVKVPVIMVEYQDRKFQETTTVEKISRFMNEEGYHDESNYQKGSVKDYFKSQSRGMFNPDFNVVAKVTLDHPYAYYGTNTPCQDYNATRLFQDAVKGAIAQGVDFSPFEVKYRVPNVIILYAGYGEATGGDANCIWPHERDLSYGSGTVGDYIFGSYFMGNELYGGSGSQLMGMGVMVHELGHALGLPDFYETQYKYQNTDAPMGVWSVMDGGEYYPENTAYAPVGYNAYERSYLGWLNIRELSDAESVTLANPSDTEGEMAVMMRNPSDSKEYFIMENRASGTWYPADYGTGLLLYRIAYNKTSWQGNTVNINQNQKRAMVVTASGRKMTGNGQQTDLFGNGVNSKTSFSWISGTTLEDAPIYKILKNSDGTLTFNFKDKTLPTGYAVANEEDVYEKVTDINTLAPQDKVVFVNEADGVAFSVNSQSDSRGAVAVKIVDGKVYGNDYVMPFTALRSTTGLWGFRSANNTYLAVSNTGLRFVTKADGNCMANITFADGNASIAFTGSANRKNFGYNADNYNFSCFTDAQSNLQIYRKASTTGISTVNAGIENKGDGKVYNLSGQQVGDDYKGIVIVNGKKVVRK